MAISATFLNAPLPPEISFQVLSYLDRIEDVNAVKQAHKVSQIIVAEYMALPPETRDRLELGPLPEYSQDELLVRQAFEEYRQLKERGLSYEAAEARHKQLSKC